MEVKLRKADGWHKYHDVYEMNLGSAKWYYIHRKNMDLLGPAELVRNLFNSLLLGLVATVRGAYSRQTKKLRLEL